MEKFIKSRRYDYDILNILAQLYRNSGILSTDVPDVDTGIDWLDCFAQNLQ